MDDGNEHSHSVVLVGELPGEEERVRWCFDGGVRCGTQEGETHSDVEVDWGCLVEGDPRTSLFPCTLIQLSLCHVAAKERPHY